MHEASTHLALLLDAPLQSWGYQSKFDRRTSFSSPTRSGILGMLCAAMGVDRADSEPLAEFATLEITVYTLQNNGRLTDFHTVGGGWNKKTHKRNIVPKADDGVGNTVVTRREYLQSSTFGVVLRGPRNQLEPIGEALQNPRWGIWLGRKSCIPAVPIMQGLFDTEDDALQHLCKQADSAGASRVCREVTSFEDGTDTLMDTPSTTKPVNLPPGESQWSDPVPIFEKPPLETLTAAQERWTPVYFEHGRLEVDDSSVKWIGADRTVIRLPVATVSALMLGPGTTVTHAAMKACADCNTPVCWVGEQGMRFYSLGVAPTHDNARARHHAAVHASTAKRTEVARRMFKMRFGDEVDVDGQTIQNLRGMEGRRVKALYAEMGAEYGVTWKGRNYNPENWQLADNINRAVSAANASLYALTTAVVCSMGYLPQLGFIHAAGTLPFVFDIADIYKPETTLVAAFHTLSIKPDADEKDVLTRLKAVIEERKLVYRLPRDIEKLLAFEPEKPKQRRTRRPTP